MVNKIATWIKNNSKAAIAASGGLALVLIGILAWIVFGTPAPIPQDTATPVPTLEPSESLTDSMGEEITVGPESLPSLDVSPQIATWKVTTLEPIPATTDPVEFATAFAKVWMAPNYTAYDGDAFTDWVFEHFSRNDVSTERTYSAQVSIRDQIVPLEDWDVLAAEKQTQAVQILSVEQPEWTMTGKATWFVADAEKQGWPNITLIEAYGLVFTKGLIDGKTPLDYADLHRDIFAVKCDPYCGIADVLSPLIDTLGGLGHGKTLDEFNLASDNHG